MKLPELVYQAVRSIPPGKVSTYGRIAQRVGIKSARQIGRILHQNPDPFDTPCHRVVFRDGSLAPGYAFGGAKTQRNRLEQEGVLFIGDKVDLSRCLFELEK